MRWLCLFGTFVSCLIVNCVATAADFQDEYLRNWHQWRGPVANGVAPFGDPPVEWSEETNIKWKKAIPGRGSSSPIVWKDRVFLLTAIETDRADESATLNESEPPPPQPPEGQGPERREFEGRGPEGRGREGRGPEVGRRGGRRGGRFRQPAPTKFYQFVVLCLDRNTGEVLWERVANEAVPHESLHSTNTYASSSATTDGKYLYAFFGSFGVYCYDLEGELKWSRDLGEMQTRNSFGEGASPTIHDGTLVVNWDHEGPSFITALDAATGETKWKRDRDEVTTWNTPLVVEAAGRTQVIVNATNRTRSYDLDTGETLWECGGQVTNPIPSPVAWENLVYCMSGHRGSALYAIPLDSVGDITDTEGIAWHRDEGTPYVPSPLLYDDRLYFTKGRNAIFSCLNAETGEPIIDQERLTGVSSFYASPVGAAGRIYLVGRGGTTLVLKQSDQLEVLATNVLDEPIDASPAIVDKEIFLRGEKHLYCIAAE